MNSAQNAITRPFYWSVRRELWENRSITIAPLVVAAVVLFGSLVATFKMPHKVRSTADAGPAAQRSAITRTYRMAPAPIMLASFLVGMFYSLDALYGERRDRSILFWKSLPVSDRTVVLAKAAIPMAVLPAIAFALSVVAVAVLLLAGTAVLLANGLSAAAFWAHANPVQQPLVMLYGLTVHALWFAPIYGWLLLVSVWARRTPLLWAVLPPFALCMLERAVFDSPGFTLLLKYRVLGAMHEAFNFTSKKYGSVDELSQLDPLTFLASSGLWSGLAFAALCLAAAIRLRRNREPI